ncbi:MAG: hypothetical protein O3C69_06020 [Chloroflexi bacterium]|nr:hypothetical protein [Chloroflexota bacterium]
MERVAKVLAWRLDHAGDCNRYENCVEHPYSELPGREGPVDYPGKLPDAIFGLESLPVDAAVEDFDRVWSFSPAADN